MISSHLRVGLLAALSQIGAPHRQGRPQITDTNRTHRERDTDDEAARIAAAQLKRARRAAKRVGAVTLDTDVAVTYAPLPK